MKWRCKDGCGENPPITEEKLHRAVVEAFKRLLEKRDELIRIDERIQAGGIELVIERMQDLEKRQDEIKRQLAMGSQENVSQIIELKRQLDELAVQYDNLLTKRAEMGVQWIQAKSLLDLVDSIEGRVTLDMAVARQSNPAACYDTDDFIQRTSRRYEPDTLDHFNDDLTRRFVEKVIVKEDSITVRFKAGIEVTI